MGYWFIYKKHVPVERLVKIRIGGKDILTTRDHLFFTDDGWVHASELKVGDVFVFKNTINCSNSIYYAYFFPIHSPPGII